MSDLTQKVGPIPREAQTGPDSGLESGAASWVQSNHRRGFMSVRRTLLLAALISMAPTALVLAQTEPQSDQTSPSAASSPHQRDATKSNTPEASPTDNTSSTSPSAASTPHQQQ